MKLKRILSLALGLALSASISMTAFASEAQTKQDFNRRTELTEEQRAEIEANRPELTEEQKAEKETRRAEMEANRTEQNNKWASLSDSQKEQIYTLMETNIDNSIAMIEAYESLGFIDSDTATERINQLNEQKAQLRTSSEIPMFGFKGNGMKDKGYRNGSQATESETN